MVNLSGRAVTDDQHQLASSDMKLPGLALILAAYFLFACLDTSAKYLVATLAPLQIVWVRFATHSVFAVVAFRPWQHPERYRTNHPILQFLRAICVGSATIFNFIAVQYLQLAETAAIFFLAPFIVTALAGPFLGEWAGIRRWTAICIGFVGALLIVSPDAAGFRPAMLLSFCSTLSYSFYLILTRRLSPIESTDSMTLWPGLIMAAIYAPVGLLVWQPVPDILSWGILLATGLFGGVGHFVLIKAHQSTPAPTLAPFLYTELIWMVLFGYMLFGDFPGTKTIVGASVIIASGLYLFRREKVVKAGRKRRRKQ